MGFQVLDNISVFIPSKSKIYGLFAKQAITVFCRQLLSPNSSYWSLSLWINKKVKPKLFAEQIVWS
jgi:hypothetical protein